MNPSPSIEQQLEAYLGGCLCGAEADALEEKITSDPAVARAYADAMLRQNGAASGASCGEKRHDDPCEAEPSGLFDRLCRLFGGS